MNLEAIPNKPVGEEKIAALPVEAVERTDEAPPVAGVLSPDMTPEDVIRLAGELSAEYHRKRQEEGNRNPDHLSARESETEPLSHEGIPAVLSSDEQEMLQEEIVRSQILRPTEGVAIAAPVERGGGLGWIAAQLADHPTAKKVFGGILLVGAVLAAKGAEARDGRNTQVLQQTVIGSLQREAQNIQNARRQAEMQAQQSQRNAEQAAKAYEMKVERAKADFARDIDSTQTTLTRNLETAQKNKDRALDQLNRVASTRKQADQGADERTRNQIDVTYHQGTLRAANAAWQKIRLIKEKNQQSLRMGLYDSNSIAEFEQYLKNLAKSNVEALQKLGENPVTAIPLAETPESQMQPAPGSGMSRVINSDERPVVTAAPHPSRVDFDSVRVPPRPGTQSIGGGSSTMSPGNIDSILDAAEARTYK